MTLPTYFTGTVSVTNGGTTVTGSGTIWSGANAKEGDFFVRSDGFALITEVTDTTHLEITPWPGATVAGGVYSIAQNYNGRILGVAAAQDVGTMLKKLHTDGLPFLVGLTETVPDPSLGDDGQYAYKPDTGAWWLKTAGAWVVTTAPVKGYGGTSTTSLAIGSGSKVFTTDQTGLAYNGARVRAASAANPANWMAGTVTYSGTTLTMTVSATGGSGTHADWVFSIDGQPGTGDMQAANNLSELTATAATARANIYAAPFNAMAFNGMQINGGFEVDQEHAGAATTFPSGTNTSYVVDGWTLTKSGTSVLSAQPVASTIPGFSKSLQISVTTAQASIGSDTVRLENVIEGWRFQKAGWGTANAMPITWSGWIEAPVAGTYGTAISSPNFATQSISAFTIATANTPQFVTMTFSAQTAGTWGAGSALGARCFMFLANSGQAANAVGNTSYVFKITGVSLSVGSQAPTAAQSSLIMRPYDQELVLCQRYWQKSYATATKPGTALGAGSNSIQLAHPTAICGNTWILPVRMRATPTITLYDGTGAPNKVSYYAAGWNNGGVGSPSASDGTLFVQINIAGATFAGFDYTLDSRF
ncbi:hypothetical protein ACVWZV_005641 [Bradyrhizobium sp. GM5.1]